MLGHGWISNWASWPYFWRWWHTNSFVLSIFFIYHSTIASLLLAWFKYKYSTCGTLLYLLVRGMIGHYAKVINQFHHIPRKIINKVTWPNQSLSLSLSLPSQTIHILPQMFKSQYSIKNNIPGAPWYHWSKIWNKFLRCPNVGEKCLLRIYTVFL